MLFDTVGSFGLPGNANNGNKNLSISPNVVSVNHAISATENRHDFPLTSIIDPTHPMDSRLSEQVFSGVHTDVGGGYRNNLIANDPLYWMVNQAVSDGVPLLPVVGTDLPAGPGDINRMSHNEFYGDNSSYFNFRQFFSGGTGVPRNIFYQENPVSPHDTSSTMHQGSSGILIEVAMPQHQQFMESIQAGSGQPLIYMNGGSGIYDRNWRDNLLNSIFSSGLDEEK